MDNSIDSHYGRVIFLTGAPQIGRIEQENTANLVETYLPAFLRFLDRHDQSRDEGVRKEMTISAPTRPMVAKWRSITVIDNLLPLVDKQFRYRSSARPSKVVPVCLSSDESIGLNEIRLVESPSGDSHENSILSHANLQHSQGIACEDDNDLAIDTLCPSNTTAISNFTCSDSEQSVNEDSIVGKLRNEHLCPTALSDLPTAHDVNRLIPQTVTVSLLVVALKVNFRRQVQARRSSQQFDLVEILVGDDTRGAFNISIWLMPLAAPSLALPSTLKIHSTGEALRSILDLVRVGDVLLLRNIALTTWKGLLYGQNLRRRVGNVETKINIIERKQTESCAWSSHLAKRIVDVQKWATFHVGNMRSLDDDAIEKSQTYAHLPPDTQ